MTSAGTILSFTPNHLTEPLALPLDLQVAKRLADVGASAALDNWGVSIKHKSGRAFLVPLGSLGVVELSDEAFEQLRQHKDSFEARAACITGGAVAFFCRERFSTVGNLGIGVAPTATRLTSTPIGLLVERAAVRRLVPSACVVSVEIPRGEAR